MSRQSPTLHTKGVARHTSLLPLVTLVLQTAPPTTQVKPTKKHNTCTHKTAHTYTSPTPLTIRYANQLMMSNLQLEQNNKVMQYCTSKLRQTKMDKNAVTHSEITHPVVALERD